MDLIFVLYLILIYAMYTYVVFEKRMGTIALSMVNIIFSFFVLLHLTIGFSERSIYIVGFLMMFLICIIGITQAGKSEAGS